MNFFIVLCFTISAAVFARGIPNKLEKHLEASNAKIYSDVENMGIITILECIQETTDAAVGENTPLGSLVEKIQEFANGLKDEEEKCRAKSEPYKSACIANLYVSTRFQFPEQEKALVKLQQGILACVFD